MHMYACVFINIQDCFSTIMREINFSNPEVIYMHAFGTGG